MWKDNDDGCYNWTIERNQGRTLVIMIIMVRMKGVRLIITSKLTVQTAVITALD